MSWDDPAVTSVALVRVVRIYHAGRSRSHRARERALAAAGARVTLIVPSNWTEGGPDRVLESECFDVLELPVRRPNDVNRHTYSSSGDLRAAIAGASPDLVDLHEEPFSAVVRQALGVIAPEIPTLAYTAQNLDKRFPPPFPRWERAAFARLSAVYPCSRQAASVVRGRGFGGLVDVMPLGFDKSVFFAGNQRHDAGTFVVSLIGRLVPEKGIYEALQAFQALRRNRAARLSIVGDGPLAAQLPTWLDDLGIADSVSLSPWGSAEVVAAQYRTSHVVLVPSRSTSRWVEQFGRMIIEAQACGAVVVGFASGTIPEVARDHGRLCAEGNSQGLANALRGLADDPTEWHRLRSGALGDVHAFTWESVAAQQIALYESVLTRPRETHLATRESARSEFGPPAMLGDGVMRPFALPVLRDMRWLARLMGG